MFFYNQRIRGWIKDLQLGVVLYHRYITKWQNCLHILKVKQQQRNRDTVLKTLHLHVH
jgi:hypothetical protein